MADVRTRHLLRKIALALAVAFVFEGWAGTAACHGGELWKRLCARIEQVCRSVVGPKKSMHAFFSPHFGYYPNTWRRWPADWENWRQRYNWIQTGETIELPAPQAKNRTEANEKHGRDAEAVPAPAEKNER